MNARYQRAAARQARVALKILMVVGLAAPLAPPAAMAWTLSGGGVWDTPNAQRISYNPAIGAIGNMGDAGVVYNVAAAPAAAQADAAGQATAAFDAWDDLGGGRVRINLVAGAAAAANVPVSWVAPAGLSGAPGATSHAHIDFHPRAILLDNTRTLRTDGWTLDFAGTRLSLIDEYDVYTTVVHEAGHSIGLGHPPTNVQVMTPQDAARQNAGGSWRAIELTTPFPGQPTKLSGAALPAGARTYSEPRDALTDDDRRGARTIYTPPGALPLGIFTPNPQGFGGVYSYSFVNESALGSDYLLRESFIPVPFSVFVANATVSSPDWSIMREAHGVRVKNIAESGLSPGETLHFAFSADQPPRGVLPSTRWRIFGLEPCGGGDGDLADDEDGCMVPSFHPSDFTVLDGRYTYGLSGESWQLVPYALVVAPVPEPATLLLAGVAACALAFRRSRGLRR